MCFLTSNIKYYVFFLLLLAATEGLRAQYRLVFQPVDSASHASLDSLSLTTGFKTKTAAEKYISNLENTLQLKGYPAASVDSIRYDSALAQVFVFLGQSYQLDSVSTAGIDNELLENAGWNFGGLRKHAGNIESIQQAQTKLLDYLENNGYPFSRIKLDSVRFENRKMYGKLVIEKGPKYKIDSIRIYGNAKISNAFMQRYLDIRNGSYYQRSKLDNISKKLAELPYLEENMRWNLTMLGTGSIINLYLQPKKSSRVNVLIGLLPANQQTQDNKILVTGDADISLRNALGNAELIGINWQQIQVKSPRLNLAFEQPYLFGSPFGISSSFDLFKKDSSFININFTAGIQSNFGTDQQGNIFFESLKSNLLTVDTNEVKYSKKLPPQIDVGSVSVGIDYQFNKTNYRLNPLRGSELQIRASAGTRTVKRNSVILKLYDPVFSYASLYDTVKEKSYRIFLRLQGAHYFQVGRQSTLRSAVNVGLLQSPSLFRNELFQIGGYRLLRGFDEESIYASQYLVSTMEFRYLIATNSFLFTFFDAGFTANKSTAQRITNQFFGSGLGLALETKAGIFNISYAVGKRDDSKFDIRQSKIHIGYVNYF